MILPNAGSPMAWRKPSFCQSSECAQVAIEGDQVLLRSTRSPGEVVAFSGAEWQALVKGIQAGEFPAPGA
jgi:hypothetical protein